MKKLVMLAVFAIALTGSALAQNMVTPKSSSADYKGIVAAIKEYDVAQHDEFEVATYTVNTIRVQGLWAFATVEPKLQGDGESLNYGVGHVFLEKKSGKWVVAFSTHNDKEEVGVDGLAKLKKNKAFPKALAKYAESQLAG
ncbi:MAG TPA: hypothetical protein PLL77_16300 [Pyrinomonadaceae bacterium]|nr:hypothetical protein [Pyrinomonadaceae bacterium]